MSVVVSTSSRCFSSARIRVLFGFARRRQRQLAAPSRPARVSAAQCFRTLSCIRSAVALSMDTTIALPTKPRPRKCRTMSCATVSSRSSRVIRWYCRPSSFSSLASCSSSRSGVLDQVVDVVVQVGIDQLQLRRAVLVEQRHRRAVLDRLLEVVDRDVVAEDLLGALLAGDQRRAGEGQEQSPSAAPRACSAPACRTGCGAPRRSARSRRAGRRAAPASGTCGSA